MIGFDDPIAQMIWGTNVFSRQQLRDVGYNSCSNQSVNNVMNSFLVQYGDLNTSGCVTTEVLAGHSSDIYVSVLADTAEETCVGE